LASRSGLENREYGRGNPLCWPRDTLYPQKLTLTSPTIGGRSVGIVRLRTKATEFVFCIGIEISKPKLHLFISHKIFHVKYRDIFYAYDIRSQGIFSPDSQLIDIYDAKFKYSIQNFTWYVSKDFTATVRESLWLRSRLFQIYSLTWRSNTNHISKGMLVGWRTCYFIH
jgi:hypothetical protein